MALSVTRDRLRPLAGPGTRRSQADELATVWAPSGVPGMGRAGGASPTERRVVTFGRVPTLIGKRPAAEADARSGSHRRRQSRRSGRRTRHPGAIRLISRLGAIYLDSPDRSRPDLGDRDHVAGARTRRSVLARPGGSSPAAPIKRARHAPARGGDATEHRASTFGRSGAFDLKTASVPPLDRGSPPPMTGRRYVLGWSAGFGGAPSSAWRPGVVFSWPDYVRGADHRLGRTVGVTAALPLVSGAEAIAALAKAGYVEMSQRGSHVKLRRPDGATVIVPRHRELARGTLRSVLRPSWTQRRRVIQLL